MRLLCYYCLMMHSLIVRQATPFHLLRATSGGLSTGATEAAFDVLSCAGGGTLVPKACKVRLLSSTRLLSSESSTPDNSYTAKSRRPFSSPNQADDDAVPMSSVGNPDTVWQALGLQDDLTRGLIEMGLLSPTPIQQMSIPAQLNGESVAFAAATGSGKTVAYLTPLMQRLKSAEALWTLEKSQSRKPRRPRALVLAPTRELASQILGVLKVRCEARSQILRSLLLFNVKMDGARLAYIILIPCCDLLRSLQDLSHSCKLSTVGIIGGDDYGKQKRQLDRRVDVVVASPGRLLKHRDEGNVFLGDVSVVVVDETDTMLEAGFQDDIAKLIHPCMYERGNPENGLRDTAPQVVLTTATMTAAVKRLLSNEASNNRSVKGSEGAAIKLPPMRAIEGKGLHRSVPRLRHVFVDVGPTDKLSLLSDIVHSGGQGAALSRGDKMSETPLTMVFCNTMPSCR